MKLSSDPRVAEKFAAYPDEIRPRMEHLRQSILDVAARVDGLEKLEETLKWGEPSYLTKRGSTLRMDWKERAPEQYALYFKCTSKLIPTIREVYGELFQYEKNRAIIFGLDEHIPYQELADCIEMALTYHQIKHLPQLGR